MAKERLAVTRNELLEAIQAARDPEYPDALTGPEICSALGLTRAKLRPLLATLTAAGRVRQVKARRTDSSGRSNLVPAYVIAKA